MEASGPGKAETARLLNIRRREELRLIERMDRSDIDSRKECWFLMDSRWLTAWSNFVRSRSEEKDDGEEDQSDPPPGPVSSRQLLQDDMSTPLPDLQVRVDYRAVTPLVFFTFSELYGRDDSPEVCRFVVDMYKASVPVDKLVTIKLGSIAKASMAVNRIRPRWMKWDIYPEEEDEEEVDYGLCGRLLCCGYANRIKREHVEALIFWLVRCCGSGRRRSGRADISYRSYQPLTNRLEEEDQLQLQQQQEQDDTGPADRSYGDGGWALRSLLFFRK